MLGSESGHYIYQQKDTPFGAQPAVANRSMIGKLLNKYQKFRPVDADEEKQIDKKKTVYHANSLNYSQIYSDLQMSRQSKIVPVSRGRGISQSEGVQAQPYLPKSLPKIGRHSRAQQRESPKYIMAHMDAESSSSQLSQAVKHRPLSISNFDIHLQAPIQYQHHQPEQPERHGQQKFEIHRQQLFQHSIYAERLRSRDPDLRVQFENETEVDLLEARRSDMFSQNHSKMSQAPSEVSQHPIAPEPPAPPPLEQPIQSTAPEEIRRSAQVDANSMIKKRVANKRIVIDASQQKMIQKARKSSNDKIVQVHKSAKADHVENKGQVSEASKPKQTELAAKAQSKEQPEHTVKQKAELIHSKVPQTNNEAQMPPEQSLEVTIQKPSFEKQIQQQKAEAHDKSGNQVNKLQRSQNHENKEQRSEERGDSSHKDEVRQSREASVAKASQSRDVTGRVTQLETCRVFNVEEYMRVYEILKTIQAALKTSVVDLHGLLRQIKKYLEVVASGCLDHLQGYEMPLHRLKIIKNALIYERIGVVIIALSHATGKLRQGLKYLINLIGYSTNNTLLILRILQSSRGVEEGDRNPVMAKSERLVLKRNFDTVRNNSDIILDAINKISKSQAAFYEPFKEILKSIGKNSIEQTFYNVLQYLAFFLCISQLHQSLPFLAVAPNPYLKQTIDDRPTLVVDIVQIFCHGTRKSKNHVFRPYSQHFLAQMAQYYELVAFTTAYPNQIDKVIDLLDPKKHIKHRLYRHHAVTKHKAYYKDSQRIGRDLSRLILLDSESNLNEEVNNTIVVPSWRGNKNDTTLAELCPILATIALKQLNCIDATRKMREQQIKNESAGIKYLNFGLNLT